MKTYSSIKQLPRDVRKLAGILQRRDGTDEVEVLEQINNALEELDSIVSAENLDGFDEQDFMENHFGLEPDYFLSFLDLLNYP